VKAFAPGIAAQGEIAQSPAVPQSPADPFLDVHFPFAQVSCTSHYAGAIQTGDGYSGWDPPTARLDWGSIDVLPRGVAADAPDAPLDRFTWSYARQVGSNALRTAAGQSERFLFYRGLGNFDLPVAIDASQPGGVAMTNAFGDAVGTVFVLNVGTDGGAFVVHAEGIAPGATLAQSVPSLAGAPPVDAFVGSLADAVTSALDATGLYHDEAVAMVSTWKRQWFRTPGVRLLYLAPQSWTEASIPLAITPAPDETRRVMMIRVEVLTPEVEQVDADAARLLGSSATAAQAAQHFVDLGRFAEPRLRRALSLLGAPGYGDGLLAQVASADTRVAAGE
jgi:hypothetical protein